MTKQATAKPANENKPSTAKEKLIAEGHAMSVKDAQHKSDHKEDIRETDREMHTNHFTNRAPGSKQ